MRARSSSRAGFTITELAVAMSTFALLTAVAAPKAETLFAHSAVKAATSNLSAQFRVALLSATMGGRTAVVRISGGAVWVEARPRTVPSFGSTVDTLGSVIDLAAQHKVAIKTSLDSVVYTPLGFAATGGVVRLTRSGISDSVVVTAIGMVKK